jgi:hypothetical protein
MLCSSEPGKGCKGYRLLPKVSHYLYRFQIAV